MNKEIIKKYLDHVLKWLISWISFFIGITLCFISIYAFDWSGVSNVTTSTTLTANLWNTTMSTITWAIQSLETWNITIWWTKTFSSPIIGQTPTANNHLATKGYVDWASAWWWVHSWLQVFSWEPTHNNYTWSNSYWADLDLSTVVWAKATLVMLKIKNTNPTYSVDVHFRTKWETDIPNRYRAFLWSSSSSQVDNGEISYIMVQTDSSWIVQWYERACSNLDSSCSDPATNIVEVTVEWYIW